ncbi:stonustoxin subunit alpha-like [Salvelinus alpinus]|uniref:stonustoxin subunit alpha-like n=1 Tax=Salvelinus alpinus TaxID=8036 RepID=UPI0039FBE10C
MRGVGFALSGCLVTEEGCASLVSALESNPSHLRELDLSYNHPGDSGVRLLSAGLEDPHCRLEKLNVEHGGENTMKPGLRKYACDLTLDPNTVFRYSFLSDGNKKVTHMGEYHPYPDHPERFEHIGQVLCREGLTGRCYWEVEWSGGKADIGVTYKGINRGGRGDDCWLGHNDKSWSLTCSDNRYIAWHKNSTTIDVCPSSSYRVGVDLDWPAGTLSFYRVSSDTLTHLYTFYTTFTEPLYPGFHLFGSGVSASLCQVDLSNNDLKDSVVKLLSAVLENPQCRLETLRLSGCLVTEEGCASLDSALKSNPSHLRELDLSYNHPGDSGVRLKKH